MGIFFLGKYFLNCGIHIRNNLSNIPIIKMSIIIAKIDNNQCLFLSDTKVSINNGDRSVTGNNKIRMLPNEGVLKIHILNPKICIAFAGNVEDSTEIINELTKLKPNSVEETLSFLKTKLNQKHDDSEFIISLILNDNMPKLYKVDKNKIEEGKTFWIGEYEAFKEFQSINSTSNKETILSKASDSFIKLLAESKIKTIGDFRISASIRKESNSFAYEYNSYSEGGFKELELEAGKSTLFSEGSVDEGAFTINSLISNDIFVPAICLCFTKGNFGYLFKPISENHLSPKPIIINGTTSEIVSKVKIDFNINLIGIEINNGKINFIQ